MASSTPVKFHQELSMYESNSPSAMSCDGSPLPLGTRSSFTARRPCLLDHDGSTQDSGYAPSETSRISPRRQISFGSNGEESIDLSEIENENATPTRLPDDFSRLISGTITHSTLMTTSAVQVSPRCSFVRPPMRRAFSVIGNIDPPRARNSLFAADKKDNKRTDPRDVEMMSPLASKRSRLLEQHPPVRHVDAKTIYRRSISNQESIKQAIQRSSTEADLVGDFTKSFCLPLVHGKHQDLKSVTPSTVAALMRGEFADKVASFKIIDCRYPYEYEGGHIRGAQNIYTKQQVIEELLNAASQNSILEQEENKRHILIFHCEFSSERAPNLSRFLRNNDRRQNNDYYPYLNFPEVYLIDGGYKNFFETHLDLCTPQSYRPMLHPEFEASMRLFRAKSKTFNADMKQSKSRKASSRFLHTE